MVAKYKATFVGDTISIDIAALKSQGAALGLDPGKIAADVIKFGTDAVATALTIYADFKAGSYFKIVTDLIAMVPTDIADVMAVLADFGLASFAATVKAPA